MKRWGTPAASRARYRCYAHARLARAEITSTRADRSRTTKTIPGINRHRHQDQHYNECAKNKQAGLHLLSPSVLHLQPELTEPASPLDQLGAQTSVLDVGYRSRLF